MKRQRDARFWLGVIPAALLVLAFVVPIVQATLPVSRRDQHRLDDLGPADVAATYIFTTREPVRRYLSDRYWNDVRAGSSRDLEELLGVQHVQATDLGEYSASYQRSGWPQKRLIEVTWTSHWPNAIGEPPGERMIFVLVGCRSADDSWKVLELGTMF